MERRPNYFLVSGCILFFFECGSNVVGDLNMFVMDLLLRCFIVGVGLNYLIF